MEDILIDIEESEIAKSKVSIDTRQICNSAKDSIDNDKIYVRVVNSNVNNVESSIAVLRRCDLRYLLGAEQVSQFRLNLKEAHKAEAERRQAIAATASSLYALLSAKNMTDKQKFVIMKAADLFDKMLDLDEI